MNKFSEFQKNAAEVVAMAKENKPCYLYFGNGKYLASYTKWSDWLFRAWPGGRKMLSLRGVDFLKSLDIDIEEVIA